MRNLQQVVSPTVRWLAVGATGATVLTLLRSRNDQARRSRLLRPNQSGPRVVILGAGFAGLEAARTLAARAGNQCRIELIDRHNYHLFTPMLFQVAACDLRPYDVATPLRQISAPIGVSFRQSTVTGIDFDRRQVELSDTRVEYDYLVVALGSTTNFHHNTGAQEHAMPMKWLEDGVAIRNRLVDRLEQASKTSDAGERRALLTVAIAGGGATGVETAAALADLLHRTVRLDYPDLDPSEARVVVVEGESKLLGHMSDRMASIALERLRSMGVEVWFNAEASVVGPGTLTTSDGATLPTRTVLWAAGVRAPEVIAGLAGPHGKGDSLVVDEYLQVQGRPGVYAVGDNAHYEDPLTHKPVPLLAQSATDEGKAAAENLVRALRGQPQLPFHYRSRGNTISLGHRAGVTEIGGFVFDGMAGSLAWRAIHLARLSSLRNQLATIVDWGISYVYEEDTVRLELEPIKPVSEPTTAGQSGRIG